MLNDNIGIIHNVHKLLNGIVIHFHVACVNRASRSRLFQQDGGQKRIEGGYSA